MSPCGNARFPCSYLDLHSSGVSGTIPTGLGSLSNLVYVDLSYNGHNGSIPSTVSSLVKVTYVPFGDRLIRVGVNVTKVLTEQTPGAVYPSGMPVPPFLGGAAR